MHPTPCHTGCKPALRAVEVPIASKPSLLYCTYNKPYLYHHAQHRLSSLCVVIVVFSPLAFNELARLLAVDPVLVPRQTRLSINFASFCNSIRPSAS